MCIHGNPSGVDNTVSSGGKALFFQRKDYTRPPFVKSLRDFPELPLLVVDTRQSRSTPVEIAKVAALKEAHPVIVEQLLDSIDHCTKSAYALITRKDFNAKDPACLRHLGELITINHGLLVSLGVSHPKLERIRALIDHTGLGWTKLTGAGGGGCAITILKPDLITGPFSGALPKSNNAPSSSDSDSDSDSDFSPVPQTPASPLAKSKSPLLLALEAQLEAEGFAKFETTLAGDGVGVLWPAVLQNASGEEGGEEIDQDKFLRAVGNDGIEALVGVATCEEHLSVGGAKAVREGWKFWRP